MHNGLSGLSTYGLNGHRKALSAMPMSVVGYGTFYFFAICSITVGFFVCVLAGCNSTSLARFLVRPKTIVFGRTYVLAQMFFLFFSEHQISEVRGLTGLKFCTMVSTRPNFIMPVQNFGGRTPKKFQGPKTCKIWPDFGRLRSSAANISETDEYIQNRQAVNGVIKYS